MPMISKETWEKLIPAHEKEKIREFYNTRYDCHSLNYEEYKKEIADVFFGKEQLQPQPLTYDDVARKLFEDGALQIRDGFCDKSEKCKFEVEANPTWSLNQTSEKQAEKLLAVNELMNVAKYLNGDWMPDWIDTCEQKWYIYLGKSLIKIDYANVCNSSFVYFRTEQLAKQALQILGEETIRLALSTDW